MIRQIGIFILGYSYYYYSQLILTLGHQEKKWGGGFRGGGGLNASKRNDEKYTGDRAHPFVE